MYKKIHLPNLIGFFFKDADEFFTDYFSFGLRIGHSVQTRKEAIFAVHSNEVHIELALKNALDIIALVFAEEAVIDKNASQLLADGFMDHQAATDESTPPDIAQRTRLSPIFSRIFAIDASTNADITQSPEQPQTS